MTERKTKNRRAPGSGTLTELPNGRWRAFLDAKDEDGTRRRISATGRTRTEAMERARAKLDDSENGWTSDRMPTVGEWCTQWVEEVIKPRRAPNTYRAYKSRIQSAIIPCIGKVPLNQLRPSHVRRLEQFDTSGHARSSSGRTQRLTQTVLLRAMDAAVAERLVDRNPAASCERPPANRVAVSVLTPVQAARLINMEPDPQWRLIWRLLFVTGMRVGELGGLTPGEIRESDGVTRIDVEQQLQRFPGTSPDDMPRGYEHRSLGGGWWLVRPKTRNGVRPIPLPADLARDLKRHATGIEDDDLMFRSSRGNPLGREAISHRLDMATKRAGLPHVNVHSARHTMATMLAMLEVPDAYREILVGHADIDTTNHVYTHTNAPMLAGAINGVAGLLVNGGNPNKE